MNPSLSGAHLCCHFFTTSRHLRPGNCGINQEGGEGPIDSWVDLKFKGFLSLFALLQLLHTYVIKLEYTVKKYPAFPLDLELELGLRFGI